MTEPRVTKSQLLVALKNAWRTHQGEIRAAGYNYETFIMEGMKINGLSMSHDEFVAWVANGKAPA